MNITEKIRNVILKGQGLPENKKKIILFSVVGVLAVIMGFFWIRGAINSFSKIGESMGSIKLPVVDTSDMPKLPDLPNMDAVQTPTPTPAPTDQNLTEPVE